MESKNSGERASGVRNHTRHLYPGLFVDCNSGVSQGVIGLLARRRKAEAKTGVRPWLVIFSSITAEMSQAM